MLLPGLSEAKGGEAKDAVADGGGGDGADEIAVFRPEMEGTAVVFRGKGVLRGTHVEEDFAVFEQNRLRLLRKEGFQSGGDLGGRWNEFRG